MYNTCCPGRDKISEAKTRICFMQHFITSFERASENSRHRSLIKIGRWCVCVFFFFFFNIPAYVRETNVHKKKCERKEQQLNFINDPYTTFARKLIFHGES